ncbi:MAG: FMN-binding protein [Bacteroidetes bacterium]|nr:FMN-binding protein [Bacteroidota bacterium]
MPGAGTGVAGTTSPTTSATTGATTPSTATPSTTVPATPTACTGTTVTGSSVSTRWGAVQVAATVTDDGTVCDLEALRYPNGDSRSSSISQRAIPLLEQRALADGLDFDAVSGATYTSEAYRDSLQSILDG